MFTLYPAFSKVSVKKCHVPTRDLVSIQIDIFDGRMVFFANIRYIVRICHYFLNTRRQNTNVWILQRAKLYFFFPNKKQKNVTWDNYALT
jgi:hypothetical protein